MYDIEPLRHSYLQPTIQLDDGIVRRNSPLFGVRPCATPVLATWGGEESEEFARQSTSFHAAWQAAGNRSELYAPARRQSLLGDPRLRRSGPSASPMARRPASHIALNRCT